MKIIFLGLPGAGKGTQGDLLAKELNLPRLSVGAILRRVWNKGGTESEEIAQYMLKGLNVPAKLLFKVLTPWFMEHKDGFVADNLPRNIDQLDGFKNFLGKTGITIDKVFHLKISAEESVKRIDNRYQQRLQTGEARPDEKSEVIKKRIEEGYQKEIKPVLDFFKSLGILVEINGEQSVEKVHQNILDCLQYKP